MNNTSQCGRPVKLIEAVAAAAQRLAPAEISSPHDDAEEIAAHIHAASRGLLHTVPDEQINSLFFGGCCSSPRGARAA